jgi:lipopolysaccharide exporter
MTNWLRSAAFTFLQRFSSLAFNFGSVFLLLRMMPKTDFGIWSSFTALVAVIEVARMGLIQNALIRYLSISHPDDHPRIITASFVLNLLLTLLSLILIVSGAYTYSIFVKAPGLDLMLYNYMVTTVLLIFFFQFQFIQQADMNFQGMFWSSFFRQGVFFTAVLTAFVFGHQLKPGELVNIQTLGAGLGAGVAYFSIREKLYFSRTADWIWVRKLFDFGRFGFVTGLSATVFSSIDQVMLANLIPFRSQEAVATQNVALRITNLVEVPTNAIADVVFPQSARRMHTQGTEAVRHLYERSVGIILAIILPAMLFVLLLPRLAILIVAGKDYLDSVAILQVTVLYTVFLPFDRQSGVVLDSMGKQQLNFYLTFFNACVNILTNYFFIQHFGIIGASYGTLTTFVLSFIIRQTILRRLLGVDLNRILGFILSSYADLYGFVLRKIKGR